MHGETVSKSRVIISLKLGETPSVGGSPNDSALLGYVEHPFLMVNPN